MKNNRPKKRQPQNPQRGEMPQKSEKMQDRPAVSQEETENLFEGRNAVMELLNAEKTIHRLFVKSGEADGSLRVILAKAKERGIIITQLAKDKLDAMSETGRHQGIIALCPPFEYAELGEVLRNCARTGEEPFIIVLDKIFDPHNFGAIIRTAAACGAHGVIIPKRRSVGITAAVVRASAGAAANMPIVRVANIAQTLDILKKAGIWAVGAEADGDIMYNAPLTGALALVIGNEDEGISRLVKEKCDFLVSIPMLGQMSSLNASVAAGVAMYEIVRRKINVSK
ncbi:MAG: 23S rRNA (guanosine(2251)-2'-O)-methyltransferase RlmB [Defluviitaleaceae bacterium]|nr:23S rRNA (guanosine(2251)-2'-O)-methyltransferase RlmB [Defluviitaleaceae bacterium]